MSARKERMPATTARRLRGARALAALLAGLVPGIVHAAGFEGLTLEQALARLEQRGLSLVYSSALVRPEMRVIREPAATGPRAILEEILAPHGLAAAEGPNGVLMLVRRGAGDAGPAAADRPGPLRPALVELGEVVISASHYRLDSGAAPSLAQFTAQDIDLLPDLAGDPLRAVARLPGIALQDYTSKPHVRGGVADETLIRFDGVRLYNPFHLKDFQSLFSTIDPAMISGLNVFTAGFPAAYGDRMSGVIDISRLEPTRPLQGSVAVSFFNAGGLLAGVTPDERTEWLVSARRGTLDLALAAVDRDLGRPRYWDAYGHLGHRLSEELTLSGSVLVSEDDLEVFDQDQEEEAIAAYRDEYYWLRLDYGNANAPGLRLTASHTRLGSERQGSSALPGVARGTLEDRRAFTVDTLHAEGRLPLGGSSLLQAGLEWRHMRGSYEYRDEAEFDLLFLIPGAPDAPRRSRDLAARPRGDQYGAYLNWRVEPTGSLVADLGLRWDRETLSGGNSGQLSPRLNLLWEVSGGTRLRAGWGRFFQAQGIDELPLSDGETRFYPAQRADHVVAGVEQRLAPGLQLRLEAYQKTYHRLRPRYENLFDTLVVLPELKPDRAIIVPDEATAYGAEAALEFDSGAGLGAWLSYSWSSVEDEIADADVRRNWDQSGYLSAGINRRGVKWDFSLAATWRSGWPTTMIGLVATEPVPLVAAGPRNAERLASYARLDARVARRIELDSLGTLTVFLELTNLTNRRNECCVDYQIEDEDGEPVLDVGTRQTVPLVPSLGFTWDF